MNWLGEVKKREADLIKDTQCFLRIKSVLDESSARNGAPFGEGIREAYDWILNRAKKDGFVTKDVDGYGAHIEWGEGEELVGILCHIDVVPEGDGWTSPPYSAEIRDGNIYARGAIDDKGPTMAAYYALKIVKELNISPNKRVRLIIGTDEESQWRCVAHYFNKEEMPTIGFAPDADFPIINGEKGICDLEFSTFIPEKGGKVKSFYAGERLNMVPALATCKVSGVEEKELVHEFTVFLNDNHVSGEYHVEEDGIVLKIRGKSAHGMEPEKGVNSGLILAHFLLAKLPLEGHEKDFFSILSELFFQDSRGERLGIAYSDVKRGDVTLNVGKLEFEKGGEGKVGINLRYPDGAEFSTLYESISSAFSDYHFIGKILTHEKPHAVDEDHPLIQTLSKVYEEQTGEPAKMLSIGGGTYARSLSAGVAFGPMFPGQEDVAHQSDEYISIDNLTRATAIYAQAIYELVN
ncbi:dipeptidase PepV [Evansella tamaricis]|uniref:Dipeptidase PepV n=1 Tax=Evansella tamaricis TaxID=2069301 RepID=A0ABS6JJB3_9BACI|nr:dipeptidase PepV [Evansella tamaricis]MBU9713742.1 dipeptidase PepV [Evansella tamaricis]